MHLFFCPTELIYLTVVILHLCSNINVFRHGKAIYISTKIFTLAKNPKCFFSVSFILCSCGIEPCDKFGGFILPVIFKICPFFWPLAARFFEFLFT